jgi:hypothetical protein
LQYREGDEEGREMGLEGLTLNGAGVWVRMDKRYCCLSIPLRRVFLFLIFLFQIPLTELKREANVAFIFKK